MIEIIVHLYLLVPLFTFLKHLRSKPLPTRFLLASTLLSLVAFIQYSNFMYREREPSLYDLMGVSPTRGFTPSELKKSYYTLSKMYHPDKNPDPAAAEIFMRVKQGYDVLGDSQKRMAYDVFGQTDFTADERIL